jgi:hypothetical protein
MVGAMNRILKRPVVVGALIGAAGLVAAIVALSLSGGSNSTAGATPTSTTTPAGTTSGKGGGSRSAVNAAQAWHNLAQCFRSHGYAIADPTVAADGTSSWSARGSGPPPREVRNAEKAVGERTCAAQYRALPPQAVDPPLTPAELHGLVLFAGCMRDKGIADWPDPNSDGAFPLNARLLALGKRGTLTQMLACKQHLPGDGISIEGPKPGSK